MEENGKELKKMKKMEENRKGENIEGREQIKNRRAIKQKEMERKLSSLKYFLTLCCVT